MEPIYHEEQLVLLAEGMQLPAALTRPANGAARWAIVLLPGSMASDVNGDYPAMNARPHLYADLAHELAERGHAVLRYAKPGSGPDAQVLDEEQAAAHGIFPQQQHIARAACALLREQVPEARLALAGHSEGSVHALLLAQQPDLAVHALVSLSGPAYRYIDLFIHMARTLAAQQGEIIDFGSFQVNAANYIRAFELLRADQPFTDEIKNDPTMAFFSQNWDNDSPWARRSRQYMRDYDAVDPSIEIARVPCPVLVVQGGLDQSGVIADNGERLYEARRAVRPDAVAKAFFADLQHFYKRATPDLSSHESFLLDGPTDERVADAISAWLGTLS